MFKKAIFGLIISATTIGVSVSTVQAEDLSCVPIGGVAAPNFFAEGEGKPIIISATLTGSVHNAAGKITAQRETPTGLEMDMEHYFGNGEGGAFQTKDLGILTAVPGKPGACGRVIVQKDRTPETFSGFCRKLKRQQVKGYVSCGAWDTLWTEGMRPR